MKTLLLLSSLVLLAGCSTSTVSYGELRVHNTRWFWSSAGVEGSVTSSNLNITVKLRQSSGQTEAIADGVAAGLAAYQGRTP